MTGGVLERYSDFIGSIYDCVIEPARWGAAIGAIANELSFANGIMALQAFPSGEPLLLASAGCTDEQLARASTFGPEILEVWGGPDRVRWFPLDEPLVQSHQTPRSSWETNRWYKEWGEPQGLFDAVAIKFAFEPTMVGSLAFGRASAVGEVTESELGPLRLIAPHVRRAVAISKLLDLKSLAAATFASTLDAMSAGVILVDGSLKTIHLNPAARMLARSDGPITVVGERVTIRGPAASAALEAAVALAAHDGSALGPKGIGIPARGGDDSPYVIHVLPLMQGELRAGLSQAAVAALFLAPASTPPRFPADALALLYDLTPAETRVLLLVADGMTQAGIARSLGVMPSTAKTHLLHVFDKTQCSRQADLVRLVASLSAPV